MGSSAAVERTHRFDGRTIVLAVRDARGWRRVRGARWTPATVRSLREAKVTEVLLRRGLRRSRLPLAWLPRSEPETEVARTRAVVRPRTPV